MNWSSLELLKKQVQYAKPREGFLEFLILLTVSFCNAPILHMTTVEGLLPVFKYINDTDILFLKESTSLSRRAPSSKTTDPHIEATSRSIVVDGAGKHVFSYSGISQYNRDGTASSPSTCGLAALNFARIVFSMEQSGLQDTTLLEAVLARSCVEVR